jgi:hypothetical protein
MAIIKHPRSRKCSDKVIKDQQVASGEEGSLRWAGDSDLQGNKVGGIFLG